METATDPPTLKPLAESDATLVPSTAILEEELWVEKAQAGHVEAFEKIYRLHVGRIYALCLRMCGNTQEAEEMTQTAFIRAWEKLDRFDGRSRFGSWLHRLAVNAVLSEWRTRGRQRKHLVSLDTFAGEPVLGQGSGGIGKVPGASHSDTSSSGFRSSDSVDSGALNSGGSGPASDATARRLDLERAIRDLPKGARTVFVLHDMEGYRHREIAEKTGMAIGTCKAQLHRARRLLRSALG